MTGGETTRAACMDSAAKFDWNEWNSQFDAKMNKLRQSVEELNRIEAAITKANLDMVRDVRSLIAGVAP